MKALIVYESMYGNTATIARSIGEGCAAGGLAPMFVRIDDVDGAAVAAYDLLIVGGPTHGHGMSRDATRQTALDDDARIYDEPTVGEGVRGWLERLPPAPDARAAVFDTRVDMPMFLTGSAAKGITKRLVGRGYHVLDGESFLVTKGNELVEGERERAVAWGTALAVALAAVTTPTRP